jgi:hypothetical protein
MGFYMLANNLFISPKLALKLKLENGKNMRLSKARFNGLLGTVQAFQNIFNVLSIKVK